ncbi:hypothetical protein BWI93_21060 [Siphonobacter sp. BAB-5385]|uniref:DUF5691 domain-containing protein n=1 Tax=Siphonobacter sp. BAB-5385 TaxID=1864822 RepID=UPI000B9E7047|nr:DUF5691 domain-containing protein [Siphonobacter sp. BAB-5385]OZI06302.1 hypothetical protein BWI93_21060 [Siphonobacter sp. BAB-5385]
MNTWNELVQVALLGTEKGRFSLETLPESIQQALAQTNPQDREGFFLQAAALTHQYERAGRQAPVLESPGVPLAEAEEKAVAPTEAVRILKTLLDQQPLNPVLLGLLLQKIAQKDWIVPPAWLVSLLNIGLDSVQEALIPVQGKRGEWLRNFYEPWKAKASEASWEEGKISERKQVLTTLRKQNPTAARERLEQAWPELNARERKDFLDVLFLDLSPADEPFLRQVQQELKGNKPIQQETRQLLIRLLATLPDSPERRLVQQEMRKYVVREKKLLGLVSSDPKLVLPETEDAFFSMERFHQHWGFAAQPTDSYQYQSLIEYWFTEALVLVDPRVWKEELKTDWPGVVTFFTVEKAKADRSYARYVSLMEASVRFRVPELFAILAKAHIPYPGLTSFTMEEWEKIFTIVPFRELSMQRSELLTAPWSAKLSKHLLRESFELVRNSHVYLEFVRQASAYWYPLSDAEMDALRPSDTPSYYQSGEEKLIILLKEILQLRQRIEAL